jgi:hypothetical protein
MKVKLEKEEKQMKAAVMDMQKAECKARKSGDHANGVYDI